MMRVHLLLLFGFDREPERPSAKGYYWGTRKPVSLHPYFKGVLYWGIPGFYLTLGFRVGGLAKIRAEDLFLVFAGQHLGLEAVLLRFCFKGLRVLDPPTTH